MQYKDITENFNRAYRIIRGLHRRDRAALDLPHIAVREAASYYLRPIHTLVTFPHKVSGVPAVGVPSVVEPCLRRLARKRVCRKQVQAGAYMDMFKLWEDLGTVVEHLEFCHRSSRLIRPSARTALRSAGWTVEAGDKPQQLLHLPADCGHNHDMQDIQDALCLMCGVVVQRMSHVGTLLSRPGGEVGAGEVRAIGSRQISTMLRQTGCGTALIHDASKSLFDTNSIDVTHIDNNCLCFRWKVPRSLSLCCASHVVTQKDSTLSWIGSHHPERESPFPAHFEYPASAIVDTLEIQATFDTEAKKATISGIEAVSFARRSPLDIGAALYSVFLFALVLGYLRNDTNLFLGSCLGGAIWAFLNKSRGDPLDSVLNMWDLFDTDEGESSASEDDDSEGEEGGESEGSLDSLSSADLGQFPAPPAARSTGCSPMQDDFVLTNKKQ